MQQLLPNCGTARSSLNASIVAPAPLVVGVAPPLVAAPAVPPPPEKYYAATPICNKPGSLPLPLPLPLPMPMPPTVGPAGSQSSGSLSLSSSNTAATTPTPTTGVGGGVGVGVGGGKPHHYNLDMSANFADINEEQANCQVQEFPRQSLVIVEKLGSGVFGELHLCETNVLK